MKKILLAAGGLTALIAVVPASAADMPRPAPPAYTVPPPAPFYSWTACYLGGGGGYAMWNQDVFLETDPGHVATSSTTTGGGRGWFGTVQVGCDYQLAGEWAIGAFGDWDFSDVSGTPLFPNVNAGHERQKWAWAAGGRLGYLVLPQLLTYVSGGWREAHFDAFELFGPVTGTSSGSHIPAHTYGGWFLGSGYEYALKWLPGWFWKTEYRYSSYRAADLSILSDTTNTTTGTAIHARKFEQAIRSELVWRFNWGGPVRAAY